MAQKVWLITGISGGLGAALVQAALQQGDVVVGTSRAGSTPEAMHGGRLVVFALDVTDQAQIAHVIERAYAVHGRLDVVVSNVGYALEGPIEKSTRDDADRVFAVNFFGPLDLIRAALPLLKQQETAHLVIISSVAGLAPTENVGLYAAAKFALEGLSQSLAEEVAPFGIWVTVVQPGASLCAKVRARALASGSVARRVAAAAGADFERAAGAIMTAVQAGDPPLNLLLGVDAVRRANARMNRFAENVRRWTPVSPGTE